MGELGEALLLASNDKSFYHRTILSFVLDWNRCYMLFELYRFIMIIGLSGLVMLYMAHLNFTRTASKLPETENLTGGYVPISTFSVRISIRWEEIIIQIYNMYLDLY